MSSNRLVLFIAGDPGGAAALLPVIQNWEGHKVVFGYRQAANIFSGSGLQTHALDNCDASTSAAWNSIETTQTALVVGATSVNGEDWERHFFVAAQARGIPSLSLLDYWSNYTQRFTLTRPLDALPDAIAIMDERARVEMIAAGFPPERLHITGQPVLDAAREWLIGITKSDRTRYRERLGLAAAERAHLFVSQPLREMNQATGQQTLEMDEFAGLSQLTSALATAPVSSKVLLVKTHPRESTNKYDSLLATLPFPARVVAPHHHRWEVCLAADHIWGVNSMLLEEAQAMKCRVNRITSKADCELDLAAQTNTDEQTPAIGSPPARKQIIELILALLKPEQRQPQ